MDDDTTLFSLSLLLLLSLKTASFFLSLSLLSNVSLSPRLYTKVPLFRYTMNGLSKKRARERDDDDDVLNDSEFSSFFFFFFFFFSMPRKAPARSLCSSSSSTREQAKMCRLLLLRRRPLDRVFRVYFLVKYLGFPQKYVFFFFLFFFSLSTHKGKKDTKKKSSKRGALLLRKKTTTTLALLLLRERERESERETTKAHRRDSIRVCVAREGSAVSFFFLFQGERRARSLCLGRESESALIGKPKRKARPLFLSFFLSFCHRRRRR